MTIPISGQPDFTKFAHKTWIWEVVNPFGKHFRKFARKGSFFEKGQLLREHRQRVLTSGRDICEITNRGKSRLVGAPTECWLSMESTQSFPCLQAAHKARHSWTLLALASSAPDVISRSHSRGSANKLTLTLHCCWLYSKFLCIIINRKIIITYFFRFKLILILIGPWIPVFKWYTGTTHIFQLEDCRLQCTNPNNMYKFKRGTLLNFLNVHMAT